MDTSRSTENGSTISLGKLFGVLREKALVVLLVALLFLTAMCAYHYVTYVPTYTSTTTFLIINVDGSSQMTLNQLDANTALAEAFTKIIESKYWAEEAALVGNNLLLGKQEQSDRIQNALEAKKEVEKAGKIAFTREEILSSLSISTESAIITVSATSLDLERAYMTMKALEETAPNAFDFYLAKTDKNGEPLNDTILINIEPLDIAERATAPDPSHLIRNLILAFLLGAILSYAVVLLLDLRDTRVYTADELKERFSEPVIGEIPDWQVSDTALDKKKKVGERDYNKRLLGDTTPFAISEAFKLLRTNLSYLTRGEKCAVFGVTSAYAGAGKSLLIANTAVTFTQIGKKVLLIDGDMRCPAQQKIFSTKFENGLSETLAGIPDQTGSLDYARFAENSEIYPGLSFLMSGHLPPNPAELLASRQMRELLEAMRECYDLILIDLPPICEVSDAGVVAELLTGYLFVVRSGSSESGAVANGVEIVKGVSGRILGYLLNDLPIKLGGQNRKYSKYGKYGSYAKYSVYAAESRYDTAASKKTK